MVSDLGDVNIVAEPPTVEFVSVINVLPKNIINRIRKCGRKRKEDGSLLSNKLKKPTRGAGSFLEYQALVKAEATATYIRIRDDFFPSRLSGTSMQATLSKHGVFLHANKFREHVKNSFDNGCLGLEPLRNRGQAVPSSIEKNIINMV